MPPFALALNPIRPLRLHFFFPASPACTQRFGSAVDGIPYDGKFLYGVVGYNMKSTEMNAAFGLVQVRAPKAKRAVHACLLFSLSLR